jgi:tetratricopeptide (TPR) repeat protein
MTSTDTPARALESDGADAQFAHGNAHMQSGRFAEAAAAYRRALAVNREAPRTNNNLAVALAEQGLFGSALAHYRESIRLEPDYAPAHFNFGNAYRELGKYAEAVTAYERALELAPGWSAALLNCGLALAALGEQVAAEANYREALAGQPDYPEAHNNLGLALQIQGQLDEAMQHFDRALELAPAFASAHANRAQLRLLHGDLQQGWLEYEWRWRLPRTALPSLPIPIWDGTRLAGRSLLLRAEQGFGDTIQFIRFAAQLHRAGIRVFVECQPTLVSLLALAPGVQHAFARGRALPQCEAQIPIASLPRVLNIADLAAVATPDPYLQADPQLTATWRGRLALDDVLHVGIAWKGSAGHPQDCHRSFAPEHFAALAAVPGIKLVSLQAGQRAPASLHALEPLGAPSDDQPLSFADTAAIVANLDLVITCDTAIAHLSGALGVPVWIALPLIPDWRWLLGRDDSPWYPSARLFRQTRLDDWSDVFARIATALEHFQSGP